MSRHRIIRNINYEDEGYNDDDDDNYSQSDDSSCISPSTADQFMYNRDRGINLSSYMGGKAIPEEEEGGWKSEGAQAAAPADHQELSDQDRVHLMGCVEEVNSALGYRLFDAVVTEAVLRYNFNVEAALNELRTYPRPKDADADAPKSKRNRKKRNQTQEGLGKSGVHRGVGDGGGVGDSGSDSSSPLQFASPPGSSLATLIQQRSGDGGMSSLKDTQFGSNGASFGSVQKHPSSTGPRTVLSSALKAEGSRNSSQSLSDFVKTRNTFGPEPGKMSGNLSQAPTQSVGLTLSDLIKTQNSPEAKPPTQTSASRVSASQTLEQEACSGLSLSELVIQNRQPPPASTQPLVSFSLLSSSLSSLVSSSSSSSLSSSAQTSLKGLSLSDLISLRSSQQKPKVSVGITPRETETNTSSSKGSSTAGLSLSQLIRSRSENPSKPVLQAESGDTHLSASTDQPLLGENVPSTACMGSSVPQPEEKKSSAGTALGGGLSLSELIKQHQNKGSKPQSASAVKNRSQDINANSTPNKTGSGLADRFEHGLSLKPEGNQPDSKEGTPDSIIQVTVKDASTRGEEETSLSLADCLKKKMTLQPKHPQPEPPTEETDIELDDANDSQTSPAEVVDFEADGFDPLKVDPALRKPPSILARCLCLCIVQQLPLVPVSRKRKARFPKFQYGYQVRHRERRVEAPLHKVARFKFGSPSPDDIVKARQEAAFGHGR
ncbi:hypothetical protein ACOMHN_027885 [Nucella lapillus]